MICDRLSEPLTYFSRKENNKTGQSTTHCHLASEGCLLPEADEACLTLLPALPTFGTIIFGFDFPLGLEPDPDL